MKKTFIILSTILLVSLLSSSAIGSGTDPREQFESRRNTLIEEKQNEFSQQREVIQQQIADRQEIRWENISNNIQNRVDRWIEIRENTNLRYSNALGEVTENLVNFEAEVLDTNAINEMMVRFNLNFEEGYSLMGNGLTALEDAFLHAQNQDRELFSESIANVNAEMKAGKDSYQQARIIFQNEIVPEYKNLINQL